VVFHPLTLNQINAIFSIEIGELSARLAEQGCKLRVLPSARRFLIEEGWDPKFGGRPLRRTIQKELEDPLALLLLEHNQPAGTVFTAGYRNGKIRITGSKKALPAGTGNEEAVTEEEPVETVY